LLDVREALLQLFLGDDVVRQRVSVEHHGLVVLHQQSLQCAHALGEVEVVIRRGDGGLEPLRQRREV